MSPGRAQGRVAGHVVPCLPGPHKGAATNPGPPPERGGGGSPRSFPNNDGGPHPSPRRGGWLLEAGVQQCGPWLCCGHGGGGALLEAGV